MTLPFPTRWVFVAALLLSAAWVGLNLGRAFIRQVLFPRPSAPSEPEIDSRIERVWLGEHSEVEAWLLPPVGSQGPAPAVIFAHGNGELIDHWDRPFATLAQAGVAVLLVEYPGYGRSGGSPSEASISAAMVAAYDWLRARPEVDPVRIVAYGRSVGGAAACALSLHRPLQGLILESTFTSLRAMVPTFVPSVFIADRFDNEAAVRSFGGKLLILHGRADEIIPYSHGQALARAAGADLVTMDCGHNDCPRPWRHLTAFLGL